jgi:sensor histidine kinase YesM
MFWFPGWHPQGKVLELWQTDTKGFFSFVLGQSNKGMREQIFFTYTLVYFLSPKFLLKGKYLSFFAGIILILSLLVFNKYNQLLNNYYTNFKNFDTKIATHDNAYFLRCAWENVMFNCPFAGAIGLSIKLSKYWYQKQKEANQVAVSKAKSELQLLKAQVHPHFLFNTLNNIYSFTLNASPKAREMIDKLTGLLHYIIHGCNQARVPLQKEISMIQDYMSLEKIRYGEQMDITIDIRGDYSDKMIAPLLLIPFVENSFKHGASKMLSRPSVNLNIIIENQILYFMLNNSKPEEYINPLQNGGIGLSNVHKSLQLLYPGRHELNMTAEAGHFTVLLQIQLDVLTKEESKEKTIKQVKNYEMA